MRIKSCVNRKKRSKPLHVHDFSRWPPFDIGNIFYKIYSTRLCYEHCYSIYQVSCQQLIYYNWYDILKYFIEIQRPLFLIWLRFPQISIFSLGPQLKTISMTFITIMQNFMLIPHSELLCLQSAWIAIFTRTTVEDSRRQ